MNKSVILIVGAVAIVGAATVVYFTHDTDAPPNDGTPVTKTDAPPADDWCVEHEIAESQCPFCNPKLIEELGWCGGHDVPEAFCTRCNPNLIPAFKAVGDWCAGHDLPESQCLICNPEPAADTGQASAGGREGGGVDLVRLDELPRDQRPPAVRCKTNDLQVRFESADIAEKAGLAFATVERRPVTATLVCNAEIAFDRNRYARISSRVAGVVHSVEKDLGDRVESGDVLAFVDSAELAAAKADFLRTRALVDLARKNYDRVHSLVAKGIATEQDDLEAETKFEEGRVAVSQAEQKLYSLGLTRAQIDALAERGEPSTLLAITAPFGATVVERSAVIGEVVEAYQPLFTLADITRMWAMLDVYESDLAKVRVGQPVLFTVDGLTGERFAGTITWISAHVDHRTRTLKARAELDNPNGLLRANMFCRAEVTIHDSRPLVVVPKAAVQWEGCCNVVFVRKSDVLYLPRKVRLGYATDNFYEVLDGVQPGETVVTDGSFLLKTEILKGSIGQGCCEVDPGRGK